MEEGPANAGGVVGETSTPAKDEINDEVEQLERDRYIGDDHNESSY